MLSLLCAVAIFFCTFAQLFEKRPFFACKYVENRVGKEVYNREN